MDPNYIVMLYDYNFWADRRLLATAEALSPAEFTDRRFGFGSGSVRTTLLHILDVEWLYLSRWQGISPTETMSETDYPDVNALRARWQQQEAQTMAYVRGLQPADLDRVVHYTNRSGKALAFPLWQILLHLANHGTQHRSEVAAMLTELGRSPGDMDLTVFLLS